MMLLTHKVPPERRRAGAYSHVQSFKYLSIGATNVGCVRSLNEDSYLDRPDIGLWAVADGMGGHEGGDVASAAVIDALHSVDAFGSAYTYRQDVCAALQGANDALVAYAEERMSGPVGATVVALLVHENHYACVWAGDSRAYLYRDNTLRRLTRDHSLVQEMVDKGRIRPEQARSQANANVITRAVGAREALELDAVHGAIRPGDRFLLCSDGLTSVVDDREIAEMLLRPPLQGAVDRLIQRALSRGAPDNVTAVLIGAEPRMGASDALG